MKTYLKKFMLPGMDDKRTYPYTLLADKQMKEIVFEPITMLYGSNGSGKSTLLNVIARKLNVWMDDKGNDAESLQPFIDDCRYKVSASFNEHCDIPEESRFIRSEDVMHGIVKVRQHNERIKEHIRNVNPELFDRFFNNREGNPGYVWSYDRWIYNALEKYKEARSNGELAFDYFQCNISEDSLVLLDEPENSLSPIFQKELAKMILDYARFFNCQFIIATHSPFLLAIKGALIYNLDLSPSKVCKWHELENIKLYAELFQNIKPNENSDTPQQ